MITLPPWLPTPSRPPEFVLDVPVALAWSYAGRWSPYTSDVMSKLTRTVAAVPESWAIDLASSLRDAERKGLGTSAQSDQFLLGMHNFRIVVDRETTPNAWSEILPLARAHSIAMARAAYLELALRLKLPLATTDPILSRSAAAAAVPIYTP